MDTRFNALKVWLDSVIEQAIISILPASEDASFRRYFRVTIKENGAQSTIIAMDAPPEHEDNPKFVSCAETLLACGLCAPKIINFDFEQGFLLVEDLGTTTYQEGLKTHSSKTLYKDAIDALIDLQKGTQTHQNKHPAYNSGLLRDEMDLFETWYVQKHLSTELNATQKSALEKTFSVLIDSALEQPQTLVHRDYHCRNLLVGLENNSGENPAVIDFQDMVVGAATYDLVSLLKDCYIEWPQDFIDSMLEHYIQQARLNGLIAENVSFNSLKKWFDLMGVQRHLKVLGIFARLNYRDNKSHYLDDLPLVKKYVMDTSAQYAELKPLLSIMNDLDT